MKEKLQPIERRPGGSLPRMTATQRKRANTLIRNTCCNYENGNCLLLDDGDTCTCPQTISYSVCCTWFRRAVLPQDRALEAEIFHSDSVKRCAECGAAFAPAPTGQNTVKPVPQRYIGGRRTPVTENGGAIRTNRVLKSPILRGFAGSIRGQVVLFIVYPRKSASNRPREGGLINCRNTRF